MDTKLKLVNTAAFCLSYSIVLAHYLNKQKWIKASLFFILAFILEIICDLWLTSLNPFTLFITALAAGVLIATERYFLYGLHVSTAILMVYQWLIAFLGSLTFILFPEQNFFYNASYNIGMSTIILLASLVLCKWDKLFIKKTASTKLLIIDVLLNVLFIFLLNYLLPLLFSAIGLLNYARLCILILISTAVNVIHKNYTYLLELENNNAHWAARMLNAKTKLTVVKYKELFEIKAKYMLSYAKAANFIPLIHKVDIPILQAVLYEILDEALPKGIRIRLHTDDIATINMNLVDLFSILNIYMKNTIHIISRLDGGQEISIWVTEKNDIFRFKIIADRPNDTEDIQLYGEEIAKSIAEKNRKKGIFINVSTADKLIQIIEVGNNENNHNKMVHKLL